MPVPSSPCSSGRPRSGPALALLRLLPVLLALSAVLWFYHWTVRTSGGFNPPGEEDYYNFLVRGWRQGHLHLSKEPRPEMLALADPLDPLQNAPYRMGDASYYKGHHYLYFGAAPALVLMWPYAALTGRELATTTTIFIFCSAGFLALSGLWLAMRRSYFPDSAWWIAPAGLGVLGLGTHVLALARRPLVWELPIAAGFAFSILALGALAAALHARRPARWFALSGLCLGLAVASRPTILLGAVMFLPALIYLWRTARDQWWRSVSALAATFGLCLAAVLAHNTARFGHPLEFGQNYQLSVIYESKMRHFSPGYLLHNLRIYFFNTPDWSAQFPFLASRVLGGGPPGYLDVCVEGICGVALVFPALWFALAAPLAPRGHDPAEALRLRALVLATAAFATTQTAVILGYFVAMIRYAADFGPPLALLAMFGLLGLERWAQQKRLTPWFTALALVLLVGTALGGLLASLDYHHQLAKGGWPDGWRTMEAFFSGETSSPK